MRAVLSDRSKPLLHGYGMETGAQEAKGVLPLLDNNSVAEPDKNLNLTWPLCLMHSLSLIQQIFAYILCCAKHSSRDVLVNSKR